MMPAVNFAATTAKSPTGAVIKVSYVPENFSCANSRMVIKGAMISSSHQKNSVLKNSSVTGSGVGSCRRSTSRLQNINPVRNATAAMIT